MTAPTDISRQLGTHAHDAAGQRDAARALLLTPIVTTSQAPELLALVRRHATALKTMFATQLGYTLTVESTFARLVKTPLEPTSPDRALIRQNGSPFGASHYALLALACGALLAPGVTEQVLVSNLVKQIRSDAAENGIALSDNISDRRRLVAALTVLLDWGVLIETDGSVARWGDGASQEALLTIARPLLPHLLSRTLGPNSVPAQMLSVDAEQPRRHLRRRLVEDPVVLRRHLSADELDVLSRERTEITRQLDDNFGLTLEVRAEGALAYDADGSLTDIEFPGGGSLKQACLLLIGEIVDRTVDDSTAMLVTWPIVDAILGELVDRYSRAWKSDYTDSVATLRDDVVGLLEALHLAEYDDAGLTLFAAAARYRPNAVVTPRLDLKATQP
jgi:uncharacterized protein (TIGR02678 family)